jgi:hypothetical protein
MGLLEFKGLTPFVGRSALRPYKICHSAPEILKNYFLFVNQDGLNGRFRPII